MEDASDCQLLEIRSGKNAGVLKSCLQASHMHLVGHEHEHEI